MEKSARNRAVDIAERLASLSRLNAPELRALWLELYGRPLAIAPRKDFLVRCLAYRLQEHASRGLGAVTRKRLHALANELAANPASPLADVPRIKPGTKLVREWRGETHIVLVGAKDFAYQGERYASLSEVARRITGTRWSGPLFFGLKTRKNAAREARRAA